MRSVNQRFMQSKRDDQPTFFDMAMQQRGAANQVLETISREVDFSAIVQRVGTTYRTGGRPACRAGVMVRGMILEHLHGLCVPLAVEQIKDRWSFQKFVRLVSADDYTD